MPAPSPLSIATSSVQRLVKEEAYYHKELADQGRRVDKLQADVAARAGAGLDENAEYMLKQEKQAMEETRSVFGPMRGRIADAVAKLEEQIALAESEDASADELSKAKETLKKGKEALKAEE